MDNIRGYAKASSRCLPPASINRMWSKFCRGTGFRRMIPDKIMPRRGLKTMNLKHRGSELKENIRIVSIEYRSIQNYRNVS
jgi:hypothetical protein